MASNIINKTIYIENIICVNCENLIERELSELQGVLKVKASYSSGQVTITYDEDIINLSKIQEAIEKEDYHITKEKIENKFVRKSNTNEPSEETRKMSRKSKDYSDIIGIVIIIFALYMIISHFGLANFFNNFPLAKEGMGYGMLFLIGLLTSVHCVAMCGGICLTQCVPKQSGSSTFAGKFSAIRPSILYNLGRVISYTIIGGIVGAVGSVVSLSGALKGSMQILVGVFMVIMGLNMLNIFPWLRKFNPRLPKIFAKKIIAQRNSNSPLYIGLLNGLMPCGPLQAMQLYALSTGSPLKGALSMFLFSVGTVPLMFAFGALSSFINKKFTGYMMKVSAVLVLVLGIFMFNNGVGLAGVGLPDFASTTVASKATNVAVIQDGVQVITTGLSSGRYEPIVVQKGMPVKWIIQAEDGDINGCNYSMVISKYNIQKDLEVGDNVIEFTPTENGTVPYSCWMGMIRSKITVVDDLSKFDESSITDNNRATGNTAGNSTGNGGSCCSGMTR